MLKKTQKLLIYNRLFVTVLLILIQAGWLVLFFRYLLINNLLQYILL